MPIKKATFLIDGFNLYHSVRTAQKRLKSSTKWLDIKSLCESRLQIVRSFVKSRVELGEIYYFSAYAYHLKNPGVIRRHKNFVRCLEDSGISVQLNRFKYKEIECSFCGKTIAKYEEKETDVSIALKLIDIVISDECDIGVLVSGDTDLAPAVRQARKLKPEKHLLFAFPAYRKNNELAKLCPNSMVIKANQYARYQFSDPYFLKDGTAISKPKSW